jgi:hypothetical protein
VVASPTIANVTFPSAATRGAPFAYGATVTDRWVTPTSTWNFGDNTSGPLTGSKTYTGTGAFNPVLTATDPFGNTATFTRSITVSAPPSVAGTGGAGGSGQIAGIASVTGLHQSHRIWRAGGRLATFAAKHSSPVGTTFTFTLDQAATVSLSFTRPGTGRTVGGKCVAANKRNRKHRKCARVAGTITHAAHAGVNTVRFQGRVSPAKKLAPGSYTLVVTATGASGQTSTPQTIKFTIVKH